MKQINVDWDKYACQYDAITIGGVNPAYVELIEKLDNYYSVLHVRNGSIILDLGGGTGNFSIPIAKKYPQSTVVIIDNSETMIEQAITKIERDGLKNVHTFVGDCEHMLEAVVKEFKSPIDHAIMVHALYTMRTREDPEKPQRILDKLCQNMNKNGSTLFLSDINRPLKTGSWIFYAVWNGLKTFKSLSKTYKYFIEHDEAKRANRFIDQMQKNGHFLLCDLKTLEDMVLKAGFSEIFEKSDCLYRGRDNLIIAGK